VSSLLPPTEISPSSTICKVNNTQLTATGGFAYSWSPSTGLSNPNISNPVANPDTTTTYTVDISIITASGDTCYKTLSTTIFVIDPSLLALSATTNKDTILEGQSTTIHAITDTTLTILWSPAAGLNNPNSFNPTASPSKTTTYTVTIVNSSGCSKSATVTIYVKSMKCNAADIFVPNTFTPNGDGNN